MKNSNEMATKILFETENGRDAHIEIKANSLTARAGLLAIIDHIAGLEKMSRTALLQEMLEISQGSEAVEEVISDVAKGIVEMIMQGKEGSEEPECDGDCENCEQARAIPPEVADLLSKLRGGKR